MLSTIHRRRVLEYFNTKDSYTFLELKKEFIDSGDMNPTTLYRIVDAFLDEGVIHEIHIQNNRIFTLCHGHTDGGVRLSYCTKCAYVSESHFPIAPDALRVESVEFLRYCTHCK